MLKSPRHRYEDAGTHSGKIITLMVDLDILSWSCTHVSKEKSIKDHLKMSTFIINYKYIFIHIMDRLPRQ